MKRRVCVIASCREHADDPTWLHVRPKRKTPVRAHLFLAGRERAA